jgi:hypothetical protein
LHWGMASDFWVTWQFFCPERLDFQFLIKLHALIWLGGSLPSSWGYR